MELTKVFQYRGPDQRKEERAIVLGMACPRCRGPVHDPTTTRDTLKAKGTTPFEHGAYACMDVQCGWDSHRMPFDDSSQYPKKRKK